MISTYDYKKDPYLIPEHPLDREFMFIQMQKEKSSRETRQIRDNKDKILENMAYPSH